MHSGVVFDIQEFSVHDGPGIRTTVFMKGCPLRCAWCHNPEGLRPEPQIMRATSGERQVGTEFTSDRLADILNRQADLLRSNEGGVTFSGGEPLYQAAFVAEVIDTLLDVHVLLDTSGYASAEDFLLVARKCRLVYFDLKLVDSSQHRRFTGMDNRLILQNLMLLATTGIPFVIRVPLVPGVTDTRENLEAISALAAPLRGLQRVELLPYNRAAGAKYEAVGMRWRPSFDEGASVRADVAPFSEKGIEVTIV
jgi:pyruvate formate lyase activating enzyme